MARASDFSEGVSRFGGGPTRSWIQAKAPYDPQSRSGAGLADKPGGLILDAVSDAGVVTSYYVWVDANGRLHVSSTEPTDQDGVSTLPYTGFKNVTVSTVGIDPQATVLAGSTVYIATTVTGVAVGDLVLIERQNVQGVNPTGFMLEQVAKVTTDTITVALRNLTNAAIVPEPETVRYTWFDLT